MEEARERISMHLHRALRAKFLTAEASDAGGSINFCLFILNYYRFCGTDITAYSAAYAHLFF